MKTAVYYNAAVKVGIGTLQTAGAPGAITTTDRSGLARSFTVTERVNFIDVKSLADTTEKSLSLTDTGSVELEFMYDFDTSNPSPVFMGNTKKWCKVEVVVAEGTPMTLTYTGVVESATMAGEVDGMITERATIKLGTAYYTGL